MPAMLQNVDGQDEVCNAVFMESTSATVHVIDQSNTSAGGLGSKSHCCSAERGVMGRMGNEILALPV